MSEDSASIAVPSRPSLGDPLSILLVAVALAGALVVEPFTGLGASIAAATIAAALILSSDLTGARLFALAVAARFSMSAALGVVAGRGTAVFPDEADYAASRWSIESGRLASGIAGALAVVALWRLGRYIAGERAARRASVLLAVFPSAVVWSASGLKEGAVMLFAVTACGFATLAMQGEQARVRVLGSLGMWCSIYLLALVRESVAFAMGGAAILAGLLMLRRRRFGTGAISVLLAVLVTGTALWATGYGVMGVRAIDALKPGAIDKAHSLESGAAGREGKATGRSGEAASGIEATSPVEPADATMLRRMAARLPGGLVLTLLRPFPFETATGALSTHAGLAHIVIFPDQLLWYAVLAGGALGVIRSLRRCAQRSLIPAIFVASIAFFYGLAQANVGTSYRMRAVLIPFVALFAFVPFCIRQRTAAQKSTLILPTLGEGGTERHALALARRLRQRGIDSEVRAFAGGIHESRATDNGAEVIGRRGRFDISLPFRTARSAGGDRVWLTYLFAGNFWGGLGARRAGVPLASNIRTTHPRSWPARLLEPLVSGDAVLVNSLAVARTAVSRGIDPAKIIVIRNGIDVTAISEAAKGAVREDFGVDADDFLIVVPGRIDPLKSQLAAVKAFAEAEIENGRLLLAGAAILPAEVVYAQRVREAALPLGNRVLMPGMVDNLPGLMSVADVVLLSSEHEGLPNAILEAMAIGIPVVATDAGGTPEAVEDGVTGLICGRGDTGALAIALSTLAGDDRLRAEMGSAAKNRVRRHFGIERETDELVESIEATAERAEAADMPARIDISMTSRTSADAS